MRAWPKISSCQYFEFTEGKQAQQEFSILPDQAKWNEIWIDMKHF